jgi:cellulose synthase/poly-beta-1,6-N-acetylglucosamine synthase-like glycosyltransferase
MQASILAAISYWVSFWALVHTWFLYGAILWILVRRKGIPSIPPFPQDPPTVSVIVAAHNEEKSIEERLRNLQELHYDPEKLEILVASDGSRDGTARIVRALQEAWDRIRLLEFPEHRGRAAVHNDAVLQTRGEIVVFTDAETRFDPHFLERIIPHFMLEGVGAVSGRIHYVNVEESSIAHSAGLYWRFEEKLRTWESALGLLAFGTGAAFCMRRSLYIPMEEVYDDVDYAETLSVVSRGFRLHYEPQALAYDRIDPTLRSTHRRRARRTTMAFLSILKRLWKERLWRRPAILVSILSHKTMRHLSPFFLLLLGASNPFLLNVGGWYRFTALCQAVFYLLALLGWIAHVLGRRWTPVSLPFTFVSLNFSRLWGVILALAKSPPSTYR